MKTMRAPKGWTVVGTNDLGFGSTETRQDKMRREHNFRKTISNIQIMKEDAMKEHSNKLFDQREQFNAQLLEAFKNKKLKSKTLIKKAKVLRKKEKEKEARKKAVEAILVAANS